MRGVTAERSSRPGELHPSQTDWASNYAVSLYNDIGGHAFHRIWRDPARPKTRGFAFDEGTVAVKLLFTTADADQVPYLRFAKPWRILVRERADRGSVERWSVEEVRLLQFDLAVKDRRAGRTGWFFGTYVYNGTRSLDRCAPRPACEQARWRQRMQPVGLQWGNDPDLTKARYAAGETPEQSVLDPDVAEMYERIRTVSGHPPFLGRWGRMNGPVDNPQSACMACHGRAVDFGRAMSDDAKRRLLPFAADWDAPAETERHFFRNLAPTDPFVADTQPLDFSLQAAIGLETFRGWVAEQPIGPELRRQTRDIPPYPQDRAHVLATDAQADADANGDLAGRSPFARGLR